MNSVATPVPRSVGSSVARFTIVEGAAVALLALAMTKLVWTDAVSQHSVFASAWLAFVLQILTFAICKLVAQQNLMAGWGIGMLLRFATLGMWAFLGVKALGLSQTPALVSLATFLFVSTMIEPFFLNN